MSRFDCNTSAACTSKSWPSLAYICLHLPFAGASSEKSTKLPARMASVSLLVSGGRPGAVAVVEHVAFAFTAADADGIGLVIVCAAVAQLLTVCAAAARPLIDCTLSNYPNQE